MDLNMEPEKYEWINQPISSFISSLYIGPTPRAVTVEKQI